VDVNQAPIAGRQPSNPILNSMDRRAFIQHSAVLAVGVSAFGKIAWSNDRYIGNSPTTTDILGPFYRPGAPMRTNINPAGYSGKVLHFYGTVFKEDGVTPYGNCSIEVWQCDMDMKYDNTSDEFKYRGRQITGTDGKYHFTTAIPVPYPAGDNGKIWRPAHIHMVVKGKGQQDLITQVYFTGDPYLQSDSASASPEAKGRILNIERKSEGVDQLSFDVVMRNEFRLDAAAVKKLCGIYAMNDKSLMEFYEVGNMLYLKWNGQIREALSYTGNNQFVSGGSGRTTAKFQIAANGDARVRVNFFRLADKVDVPLEGVKTLSY
jgi:catechol 1,2-dioxygenase